MKNIHWGELKDLNDLVHIDKLIIGNEERCLEIEEAIVNHQCLVYKTNGEAVGFLLFNNYFFDHTFISLVIVHPHHRNKGVARTLIAAFEEEINEDKIFSSTNQSHDIMHHLFHSLGYEKSGFVDNLDEGDPEIIYVKKKIGQGRNDRTD
ncbi:GNAT family N-acetyltransferase [Rossellomorea oryzaecorticis]|uniref:GNAT family N-acetyltransferase n=1 Tax=Rossellomorea oryzaecorticis TaxID=1396505 RepID=A0ABU9K5V2_9BACI